MGKCAWCGGYKNNATSRFCSNKCRTEYKESESKTSKGSKSVKNTIGVIVVLLIIAAVFLNNHKSTSSTGSSSSAQQSSNNQEQNQVPAKVLPANNSNPSLDSTAAISQAANSIPQTQQLVDSTLGGQDSCIKANGEHFVDYAEAGKIEEVRRIAEICPKISDYQNRHRKRTALMYAADHNRTDVLNYLLSKNVSLNIQDRDGRTALIDAADRNNLPVSSALLDAGADQNVQEIKGLTPLMIAIEKKDVPLVTALMAHKPDLSLKNKAGKTAFDIASNKRNGEILALLNQASR